MDSLFLSVLPLALASALSPLILGISIALLARKNLKAASTFFMGGLLVAALIAIAGAGVADGDDKVVEKLGFKPRAADFFFGAIFLLFGLKVFFEKPESKRDIPPEAKKARGPFRWLAIGFLVNITNFDAVLLNFAAARQIFNSTVALAPQLALLAFCDFFFLAPALLQALLPFLTNLHKMWRKAELW
jgi:hypothetical protein